ncbi:dipeptide ABC transporter ATP-binding protein [Rubellimicrobium arenae]|uniref:dipeptide ABC transporter ATP-binding protein n=1 Tax=Rubellimicrobium arenae TaxID=2817372 RepID=UPI001B31230C|nr:ABC transporter ATP-binding protein [Rubellimicrobium arenae]
MTLSRPTPQPPESGLEIRDLSMSYVTLGQARPVLHGLSLSVKPGEVLALVGESGSGKTTTAQAILGLLPANARIDGGSVHLGQQSLLGLSDRAWMQLRGRRIGLIPQDPGSSLNPVRTVGAQLAEVFVVHGLETRWSVRERVLDALAEVGLPDPARHHDQYPHELSGGMRQRVLIAMALALRPELVIADEPTSALDATVQRHVLDMIDRLRAERGTAVLLVTHDLAMAGDRADRIAVLRNGRLEEQGCVTAVLAHPVSAYTRRLLSDIPSLAPARSPAILRERRRDAAVTVENLVQRFATRGRGTIQALDGVSFEVARGTTHAIVGESGSGKTTAMRAIVGLQRPASGRILVGGEEVTGLRGEDLRQFRRRVQLVYQNPFASLDPRQTVRAIVEEPLLNFDPVPRAERERAAAQVLERVALPDEVWDRRPVALSGGQRQRVAIARALVLKPEVLVLDEAVSALDVTVQAQILRLLDELQRDLGLTYLFVSHDLSVVRAIADSVSVLHRGRVVDDGPAHRVFAAPRSEHTRALIAAIPGGQPRSARTLEGATS